MLQTFYNSFGFLGSISISFLIFICFIFWLAGVAGITQLKNDRTKPVKLFFSVLFPPYPIIWIFWDMYTQSQLMKEDQL
ncbi:hypothetical protein SAMN05443144_109154 [Fodinibius roseus]|uniref:Phospholipase_D-nuclease N-terminal n=1 Tax=Fodinibius roseus TaxID=1194090 RepID=A0A1M5CAD8_9BACT|nr:hypothetical protein SAMN05443144_109154 [Fodinibius roseus]